MLLVGTTLFFLDASEINKWEQFVNTPVVVICQIIIFLPNFAILVIVAYLGLIISKLQKNPIHLLNIISEFLGALARIIYFIDPMGCYRVIPTSINIAVLVFMFPFGLINCLLLSLYFQETLHLKDIKVFTFIRKTQWIFYVTCIILLVILVFIPITKETTFYDTYRLICVIVIAIIAVVIAVFYIVSGVQIIDTLKKISGGNKNKKEKRRQLSVRIIVTASCLFVMVILFFISRANGLRSPAGYLISNTIAVLAVTVAGLFSLITLVIMNTKGVKSSTSTQKTKTSTKTSDGDDKKKDEDLDEDEESKKKKSEESDNDEEDS